ncbi:MULTISPECIES: hypothetical protein [unclassified Brenneria]|uniref:dCTP deaminase domain-containing protein n=1 Tax=unclassified Brenneria TaxID=2634434 RepID=UPI0029C12170|nr:MULTISPECIES: hypothetical protein [unclassified Brenneria]MDX5627944.1 hypothetical protein [Brenneria sp. L3-3Z]MDX5695036.1 hypothetical protein [Brenneria sp. L4-2C]
MSQLLDDNYPNGMLTDTFIKKALAQLFSENANEAKAKYSTYELSLDSGHEIIKHDEHGSIQRNEVRNKNNLVSADPGDTILVYSKETFSLPKNVYARVNTVGQIFMAGFSAENTYVDPGFAGKISITLINNSNRTLTMEENSPLARVEFIKLTDVPEITHLGRSGVRETRVKPSIDSNLALTFENAELPELIKEIKNSIIVDAIQKKSVRTDIALSRAYIDLVSDIKEINKTIENQKEKIKRWSWLAALGLGTASALWIDKFGLTSAIVSLATQSTSPAYWLTIFVNIICSIVATIAYEKIIKRFKK